MKHYNCKTQFLDVRNSDTVIKDVMANLFLYILILFYLNTSMAVMINWKKLRNEILTAKSRNSYDDVYIPKGLKIYILDNPFLNTKYHNNQLRKQIDKYALEPFRSLHMSPELSTIRVKPRALKGEIFRQETRDILRDAVERFKLAKPQDDVLRRKWFSSCDRKAVKLCKKACKMSHKTICKIFRCNKDMKRRYKFECSRNCKNKFKE